MTIINFFWRGMRFGFLENIVLKSHIKVGHEPIVWLSGEKPQSSYWNDIEKKITVKNADFADFKLSEFLVTGGDFRTAADLWRFHFLYSFGGIYCDTDAFALKKFPDDEWIVCSAEKQPHMVSIGVLKAPPPLVSIGVLKAPPHHEIFLECISNVRKEWGNVQVFTDAYSKHFGHTNPTHDNKLFYPYRWHEWKKLFKKGKLPSNSYSVHFYGKMLEINLKERLDDYNERWCERNPGTLLGKLWYWLQDKK